LLIMPSKFQDSKKNPFFLPILVSLPTLIDRFDEA